MKRMSMKERFERASEDPFVNKETERSKEVDQGLKNLLRAKDEVASAVESWRQASQEAVAERGAGMNIEGQADGIDDQKAEAVDTATQWTQYAHEMFNWFETQQLSDEEQEFVQDTIDAIDAMANVDDEWNHLLSSAQDAGRKKSRAA